MPTDLIELGRRIAADPTCHDMMIGTPPRPLTMVEMQAYLTYRRRQLQDRIDRDGCCGGTMSDYGRCPESGRLCPLFKQAQRIERETFHQKENA